MSHPDGGASKGPAVRSQAMQYVPEAIHDLTLDFTRVIGGLQTAAPCGFDCAHSRIRCTVPGGAVDALSLPDQGLTPDKSEPVAGTHIIMDGVNGSGSPACVAHGNGRDGVARCHRGRDVSAHDASRGDRDERHGHRVDQVVGIRPRSHPDPATAAGHSSGIHPDRGRRLSPHWRRTTSNASTSRCWVISDAHSCVWTSKTWRIVEHPTTRHACAFQTWNPDIAPVRVDVRRRRAATTGHREFPHHHVHAATPCIFVCASQNAGRISSSTCRTTS